MFLITIAIGIFAIGFYFGQKQEQIRFRYEESCPGEHGPVSMVVRDLRPGKEKAYCKYYWVKPK